jgi:transposase InsO family protein
MSCTWNTRFSVRGSCATSIERTDHVWAMDITYLPMRRGFIYLAAVMDWATRRVLAWRVSNTLTADFCVEAVEEAIARYGKPEIFNTDQARNSPATPLRRCCMATAWRSAWTAAAAGATTYS